MSLFIAFEGGDGAGKSTQLDRLARRLKESGRSVVTTREPGATPLGGSIRELLLHGKDGSVTDRAEALLFAADRAHHIATVVRPALSRGDVVLTDRFVDSSYAYQGAGRAIGVDELRVVMEWATEGLKPDLTVLLDLEPAEGHKRRRGVHDRIERETQAFHEKVRQGFLSLAEQDPLRYLVLDARQGVHTLHGKIVERVQQLL